MGIHIFYAQKGIEVDMEIYGVFIVPLILGLVEAAKRVGLPDKWSPLFICCIRFGCWFNYTFPSDPGQGVVVGLALGYAQRDYIQEPKTLRRSCTNG